MTFDTAPDTAMQEEMVMCYSRTHRGSKFSWFRWLKSCFYYSEVSVYNNYILYNVVQSCIIVPKCVAILMDLGLPYVLVSHGQDVIFLWLQNH